MASSSSSSSSSSSTRTWKYEVFPSFRGEDVRKTFLGHLLKELKSKSINTFIDNGIERSHLIADELLSAIRESRISIVVLSKNYVSSTWCLKELAEIHDCFKKMNQMVIPVFYEVDPSHVKKQTGEFGKAFDKTCEGKTEDEKQSWVRALAEIATIAGYDSRNWNDDSEMIEEISKDVLKKLLLTPSDDFRDFVGIGAHVEAIMDSKLCLESGGVRIIGIVGPSGIGKSTIARALYSRLSSTQFDHRTFASYKRAIENRKVPDVNVNLAWARQFLSDILGQNDIKIESLGVVEQRLKHRKVLIVLDDVDEIELLETLVGRTGWFGSGSRIIVVTQDKALLKKHEIDLIYEVDFPSKNLALQMLCQSAFRQTSPTDGFTWLAAEVVKLAGNLPLCLNVLGSSLRGKDKEHWVKMMPRFRNHLNGDIEKTLRICYDGLSEKDDQDIFVYIACLFNGESVNYINNFMEKIFDTNVDNSLRTLADKSLLRIIGPHRIVQMHILLEKLGREIVRSESTNNPGKRRFLVDPKDISDVFNDNTGTENVLGIRLDTSEIDEPLFIDEKSFEGMRNLQFIKFYKEWWRQKTGEVRFYLPHQGLIYLPRKLRMLHWHEYPAKYLPSSFSAKYLVELRMEDSKLEKLWEGAQPLRSLKVMDIDGSRVLKEIPNLSNATNLEILNLCNCTSLVTLPSSIRNLKKLRRLSMAGCSDLEVLPAEFNLESLDYLVLSGCSRLRSFPRISRNISRLYLDGTAMEEEDCFWIENLSGLTCLVWENCPLRFMPSNFRPEHLVELVMRGSKLEKLWEGVQSLTNLRWMDLSNCGSLKEIPDLSNATSLIRMYLLGCKTLKEIPGLSKAINFVSLDLSDCESLEEISDLSNATNLLDLNLSGCKSLKEIPDLSKAINLKKLGLSRCKSLKEITNLSNVINLKILNLSGCESLKEIPELPKTTQLEELKLNNCKSLKKLPDSVQNLEELTDLNMSGCTSLEVLPTNINLVSLTTLDLSGCSRLRTFPQISTSIKHLCLSDTAIEEVPSWIENIDGLTHLDMRGCGKLKVISASIWNLKHLEFVDFTDCGEVTSVSDARLVKTVAELHEEMYRSCSDSDTELLFHYRNLDTEFLFHNCFNLDQDAQKFIIQSNCRYAILPGKKVPTYFTHRTRGSSLTVPSPQGSLSQNHLRFTAYIISTGFLCYNGNITVHWKFRGVEGVHIVELGMRSAKMDHMVVFHFNIFFQEDPPSQLDCENVEFEFISHYTIPLLPIKECGVRILDDSPSLDASDRSSQAEYTHQSEESGRSKKRMQMTVETPEENSNLPDGKTAVNSGSMAPCVEEEARSSEESGRSKKRIRMTVETPEENSNSLCGQTAVNSGSMALNLELSLGPGQAPPRVSSRSKVPSPSISSGNFHGDEALLNLSLSPFDPCLVGESLYFDPMITEQQDAWTSSEDHSLSPQLTNYFI